LLYYSALKALKVSESVMIEQVKEQDQINIRLTFVGEEARKYRKLQSKRGLTVANQLVLALLAEHYHSELGEA